MEDRDRMGWQEWLRFSLRSLAVLVLGISIGLAVGLRMSPLRKMEPNEAYGLDAMVYVIEPPDVVRLTIEGVDADGEIAKKQGDYLVGPDGQMVVPALGSVRVAGRTVAAAQDKLATVAAATGTWGSAPAVTLEMVSYNSKVFYVITQDANGVESVIRMPITGNETVLDAVAALPRNVSPSGAKLWIARPGPATPEGRILEVDWRAITGGANAMSNHRMLPGDRLYVSRKAGAGMGR